MGGVDDLGDFGRSGFFWVVGDFSDAIEVAELVNLNNSFCFSEDFAQVITAAFAHHAGDFEGHLLTVRC